MRSILLVIVHVYTYSIHVNEGCRRKKEESKVKQTNKAKQHSTPIMYIYIYLQRVVLGSLKDESQPQTPPPCEPEGGRGGEGGQMLP